MKFQVSFFAVALCLAVVLWFGHNRIGALISGDPASNDAEKQKEDHPVFVVVNRVASATNNADIEAVGNGRAKRSVTLVSESAGEIIALPVTAGDVVRRGDVICELDRKDSELALRLAETRLTEARRQFERSEKLRKGQVNSQANVDDAWTLLERAQFERDRAEEDLRKRTLLAPFDGVVGIPKVEEGDRVAPNMPIATLDDRSELFVEFEIPELYLSRLSVGEPITAYTPSFKGRPFDGKIDQIDTRVDPVTRSATARAVLPNGEDLLRPGMSFSVQVALPGSRYPVVPELALLWDKGASFVWVVEQQAVKQVPVQVVRRLNSRILVDGDLAKGDLVVVEGVQRLRPATKVTYTPPTGENGPLTN